MGILINELIKSKNKGSFYKRVIQKRMGYFLVFIVLFACVAHSKNIYVSATANGNGTESNPYKTISQAAAVASAGDIILITSGTYSEKNITPASSGTEKAMIVFRPKSSSDVVVLKHPATNSSDNTALFNLSNRSYIQIEGLVFKDFSYGKASILVSNGSGNFILNNRFENLGFEGVSAWDGNQMVGIYNGQNNVVCNNYFENIYGDGINVNSPQSKKNLVCDNTFIGFKGKLRCWGGSNLYSRTIEIQDMSQGDNVAAFNSSNGGVHHVWMDRNGSGNVILRNYGVGGTGLVFNESRCSTNVIQENIASGMKTGFMSAYYSTTSDTYKPRYINNVAYNNAYGFKIHKTEKDEFRNNIIVNSKDYNIEFTQTALNAGPYIFRNNLWFSSHKTNSVLFKGSGTSVSAFQSGVGEVNGLSVDPQFVNASSGDFTLATSSPAKNAGDNGYDIGAYPVYGPSSTGSNIVNSLTDVQINFSSSISEVKRTQQLHLDITLSKVSSKPITVNLIPVAGDAKEGVDFSLTKSITFEAGETSKSILIQFGGTSSYDELVAFRLLNPSNAEIGARRLHVVRVQSGNGGLVEPPEPIKQEPFGGMAHNIPGEIQFEDYDIGGEGVSYHDVDIENKGGAYRSDAVDIEKRVDTPNEVTLNWVNAGEWLEYTVNVSRSNIYNIDVEVASVGDGKTMSLSMDGHPIASDISIPNTAGWGEWTTVRIPGIALDSGEHIIRWTMGNEDYVNLNKMVFTVSGSVLSHPIQTNKLLNLRVHSGEFEIIGATEHSYVYVHDIQGKQLYFGKGNVPFGMDSYSGVVLITVSDPILGVKHFQSVNR